MIELTVKNLEAIQEPLKSYVQNYINQRVEALKRLFKRYPQKVPFEIIINKKQKGWKVDCYIYMQSETLYFEQSGKDLKNVLSEIFKKAKNQIKKQKSLERKDYLYKRERYRKKKLSQAAFEKLIEYRKSNSREAFDKELADVYEDLRQDLYDGYIEKGLSEKEAQEIAQKLMEKIKNEVYETFDSQKDEREEFLESISDISEYYRKEQN